MWSWLPTLLVIVVTAVALAGASYPPARPRNRRLWTAALIIAGGLAVASTVWQGQRAGEDGTPLSGSTMSREAFSHRQQNSPTSALTKQVKALEDRVRELEAGRQVRSIVPDTAEKFAAYLRGFSSRHVIVSCIPDVLEA